MVVSDKRNQLGLHYVMGLISVWRSVHYMGPLMTIPRRCGDIRRDPGRNGMSREFIPTFTDGRKKNPYKERAEKIPSNFVENIPPQKNIAEKITLGNRFAAKIPSRKKIGSFSHIIFEIS